VPFDVYLNVAVGGVVTGLVYGQMALGPCCRKVQSHAAHDGNEHLL